MLTPGINLKSHLCSICYFDTFFTTPATIKHAIPRKIRTLSHLRIMSKADIIRNIIPVPINGAVIIFTFFSSIFPPLRSFWLLRFR